MKTIRTSLTALLLSLAALSASAQDADSTRVAQPMPCCDLRPAFLQGWELSAGAGFQIGGTAPLPLPREIRDIKRYNPLLCLSLGLQAKKDLIDDGRWAVSLGLRFEQKGMKTKARVKGYHMEMTADDGGYMEGDWTGMVETHVRNSYLTLPLLAHLRLSGRWSVQVGPYVSLLLDGVFDGEAYDGYLRHHDPTGEKAYVTHATYDFSDDLRRWAWGVQVGAAYRASRHLEAEAQLDWGLSGIFPSHFTSVTFSLYPIYGRIGLNYVF
ncbi:MAG: PorT family protein [Bacteroidaceae bacterium]|nr:PorT family protein [Bacteroidaceae bacterium]